MVFRPFFENLGEVRLMADPAAQAAVQRRWSGAADRVTLAWNNNGAPPSPGPRWLDISSLSYQFLAVWLVVAIPPNQGRVAFVFENKFHRW